MGVYDTALAHYSLALNNMTKATGEAGTAMGFHTVSQSGAEAVVGAYNTLYTPAYASILNWAGTDRVFTVGNGTSSGRSDAMVVLKNGNTGIGTQHTCIQAGCQWQWQY